MLYFHELEEVGVGAVEMHVGKKGVVVFASVYIVDFCILCQED